ncbi:schlafen family member 8-like, partial [Ylistrum balloti]|uniref:schlafen family member 8-like n=1 Tax=Ylistrum balloti TaxID=509963 RepID=UPI002905D4EB
LVVGFPGTGKTIMARQLVLNLYNRGFEPEEILFLSQHRTSCCQIQKMERCVALTPDCLKDDLKDPDRKVMYRKIKHFIIDDAQMICAVSKDKGWFAFLHYLWKKKRSNKYSLFWVFYGDHKYCRDDGGCMKFIKNRFDHKIKLDLILRNSHSVAKNAIKYAENPKYKTAVEKITTVHNFKGEAVVCEEKLLSNVEQYLQEIGDFLNSVLSEGYHYEDVAILFSRQADIPRALDCISKEQVEKSEENLLCKTITSPGMVTLPRIGNVRICSASDNDITGHVVVDTFRRYSGLDRPVVLAINRNIGPYDVYTDSKGLDLIIATRPIAKLIMWKKKK